MMAVVLNRSPRWTAGEFIKSHIVSNVLRTTAAVGKTAAVVLQIFFYKLGYLFKLVFGKPEMR